MPAGPFRPGDLTPAAADTLNQVWTGLQAFRALSVQFPLNLLRGPGGFPAAIGLRPPPTPSNASNASSGGDADLVTVEWTAVTGATQAGCDLTLSRSRFRLTGPRLTLSEQALAAAVYDLSTVTKTFLTDVAVSSAAVVPGTPCTVSITLTKTSDTITGVDCS